MHITGQVQQKLFRPFITGFFCLFLLSRILKIDAKKGYANNAKCGSWESQLFGRQLLFIYRYYVCTLFSFFLSSASHKIFLVPPEVMPAKGENAYIEV